MRREELIGKHSGQLLEHTPHEAHGETSRNSHSEFFADKLALGNSAAVATLWGRWS